MSSETRIFGGIRTKMKEYEKHGLQCPYESIDTCNCCTNYVCIENRNPDKMR